MKKDIKFIELLYWASLWGMISCLIVCCIFILSYDIVEARECAGAAATLAVRQGNFGELPLQIYLYGPLQPYLLSIFPECIDGIMLHRCFSFTCLIGAALLLFPIVKQLSAYCRVETPQHMGITLFCLFLCPNMANMPTCLATPAMLGLLITNLIVLLSFISFRGKPFLLALLVFAGWEAKPYFVFSGIYVFFSYLFFHQDKKSCCIHLIYFSFTAISLFIASCFSPQAQTMLQHCVWSSGQSLLLTSIRKFVICCAFMIPVFVVAGYGFSLHGISFMRNHSGLLSSKQRSCLLFSLAICVCFTALLIKIGGHLGELGFIYQAQLLSTPFCLLMGTFWLIGSKNMKSLVCIFPVLILISELLISHRLYEVCSHIGESSAMETVIKSDISSGRKICHSCLTGVYELRETGTISDNGQLSYLSSTYPCSGSYLKKNEMNAKAFTMQFLNKIEIASWDVIYTDDASFTSVLAQVEPLLELNYERDAEWDAGLPTQRLKVSRWVRKRGEQRGGSL